MAFAAANEQETESPFSKLDWHVGPSVEQVVGKATLKIPDDDFAFLDDKNSEQFLVLTENLPEQGTNIVYAWEDGWWATFSFDPVGYVKDDEEIDADALMKDMKKGSITSNKERRRLKLPPIYTEGWHTPPHYDLQTKRLEWATRLRSDGQISLNYTVRLLGRNGVMSATLVSSPETLDKDIVSFKQFLTGFEFNAGERYAEFKKGDRIAEFGLAALIAGGAAAVATKKGFWAAIGGFFAVAWKLIVAGIFAAFAALRGLIKIKKKKS
uniref:DUF2167 domain-containing protein n=1 Tax=Castellaniella defragrans TaxID=75697 RepID=UPI00333F7616